MHRRNFLKAGLAGGLLASIAPARLSATVAGSAGSAKNIIFVVSDGMSQGALSMADLYLRHTTGTPSRWMNLYSRPDARRALMETASASSPVTDSAAASSAWASGIRVPNGSLNLQGDGTRNLPILREARTAGIAGGLVTTATVTHATPAGFVAQQDSRNNQAEIAEQYLEARVDVVLGGGSTFFQPDSRSDKRDLAGDFRTEGYALVSNRDEMLANDGKKPLLGTFSRSHIPFEIDRSNNPELRSTIPSLHEMTQVALDRLSNGHERFILQVEGARIDHAAHNNDAAALIHDQIALDRALGVVLDFVADRNDTLVIVCTDHGNANPGLNGHGMSYDDSLAMFEKLTGFTRSNEWAMRGLTADSSAADIATRVYEATSIELEMREVELLRKALASEHREGYRVRENPTILLGQILSNHIAVGWNGVAHTQDNVEFLALGPGSESLPGFIRNTDVHALMRKALGLSS
jgi:alkaline phosphatase